VREVQPPISAICARHGSTRRGNRVGRADCRFLDAAGRRPLLAQLDRGLLGCLAVTGRSYDGQVTDSRISVRLDPAVHAAVRKRCVREALTVSLVVQHLLLDWARGDLEMEERVLTPEQADLAARLEAFYARPGA
jgi:hypothetical protein